jgi:hypothetical protein
VAAGRFFLVGVVLQPCQQHSPGIKKAPAVPRLFPTTKTPKNILDDLVVAIIRPNAIIVQ